MAKRRLKDRRTIIVRFYSLLVILVLTIIFGGVAYGIWRPEVRVHNIAVSGTEVLSPQLIGDKVEEILSGARFYIFPKDSIFLLSEGDVQQNLLSFFPRINSVSVERTGFQSIDVGISERVGVFMWCSGATSTPCVTGDENGFLFAQDDQILTPVHGELLYDSAPVGNIVFKEGAFAKVYSLTKALKGLGVEVTNILFRGEDEVSLTLHTGTTLEYVLGEESQIAEAFPSVLDGIDTLEEIEYIDMRFGNRVYIKRNE